MRLLRLQPFNLEDRGLEYVITCSDRVAWQSTQSSNLISQHRRCAYYRAYDAFSYVELTNYRSAECYVKGVCVCNAKLNHLTLGPNTFSSPLLLILSNSRLS